MESEITDPNCIVKAFQNNNISIIKDEDNKYYFRGSDVAKALEITNIRSSIQNFTSKEKGVRKVDTLGGPQDIIFLSSHGVYRLLYSSKKKIAENFREWVGDILDDIIFNQGIELKKQLEEKDKLLEQKDKQIIDNRQKILLDSFTKKCIVYLIKISDKLYKFGNTDDLNRRFLEHSREINKDIELVFCIESKNNVLLENKLKEYLKNAKDNNGDYFRKTQMINNRKQTELIEINDITIIEDELKKLNKDIDESLEILKVQENILALQLRLAEIENKKLLITETGNLQEDLETMNETIKRIRDKKRLLYNKVRRENPEVKEREKILDKERYMKNSQIIEYKEKRKERQKNYYKKNKQELNKKHFEYQKKNTKTVLARNPEEKEKYINWLKTKIVYSDNDNDVIHWCKFFDNYLHTSARIKKIYKEYTEEYIKNTFLNITNYTCDQYFVNKKFIRGWRNLKIIQ